ncbi:MAG: lamin tail domain-containing protein, partial [Opitutaceae bacterium]
MAANTRTLADVDGKFSDWIEIHNPDTAAVSLAGWYLTDDAKDLKKWQFPDVSIPPGGFLVVFASDKNRRDPKAELHTNFELDAGGGYLGLVRPDGVTVASQFGSKYPSQWDDFSYGVT